MLIQWEYTKTVTGSTDVPDEVVAKGCDAINTYFADFVNADEYGDFDKEFRFSLPNNQI